jgi:hypothetical protein
MPNSAKQTHLWQVFIPNILSINILHQKIGRRASRPVKPSQGWSKCFSVAPAGAGVIHIAGKNLFTDPPNVLSRKANGRL